MQPIKSINIPTPCHEDWQQMTPIAQGRLCQSCSKTVTDFTAMNTGEILAYFSTNGKTCGRFAASQLMALNSVPAHQTVSRFSWKGIVAAASIICMLPNIKAQAKQPHKTEHGPLLHEKKDELPATDSTQIMTVKGRIIDKDDKLPLAGVILRIKGSNEGAQTGVDGTFNLRGALLSKTVVISYIGYENMEMAVSSLTAQPIEISLKPMMLTGDIVVTHLHVPFYKRWWHAIKRVF